MTDSRRVHAPSMWLEPAHVPSRSDCSGHAASGGGQCNSYGEWCADGGMFWVLQDPSGDIVPMRSKHIVSATRTSLTYGVDNGPMRRGLWWGPRRRHLSAGVELRSRRLSPSSLSMRLPWPRLWVEASWPANCCDPLSLVCHALLVM